MDKNIIDSSKRDSVRKNYNLIAKQYGEDFGNYIEDLDIYQEFERNLPKNARILDLGAGTGRTYAYFNARGYQYIGIDFSEEMKNNAYKIHGDFPYVIDDMINIKNYYAADSFDAVFAVYSLFHLPNNDFKKIFSDVYDLLKIGGIFLFSYQIGQGEEMVDEPYLKENGKKVLYMNYHLDEDIKNLLSLFSFKEVFRKQKIETSNMAINTNDVTTVYVLVKKVE